MSQTLNILLFTIIIIAGFRIYALKREIVALSKELENDKKEFSTLSAYNEKEVEIKNRNKDKVMKMFGKQNKISNKDVAKELDISSTTSFRYLEELEKEGKIKQNNKFGRRVYYTKV